MQLAASSANPKLAQDEVSAYIKDMRKPDFNP